MMFTQIIPVEAQLLRDGQIG